MQQLEFMYDECLRAQKYFVITGAQEEISEMLKNDSSRQK
jgi:hypothetical protein